MVAVLTEPLGVDQVEVVEAFTYATDALAGVTDRMVMNVERLLSRGFLVAVLTADELERLRVAVDDALVDLAAMTGDLQRVREALGA